jgi:hypothetical protein
MITTVTRGNTADGKDRIALEKCGTPRPSPTDVAAPDLRQHMALTVRVSLPRWP